MKCVYDLRRIEDHMSPPGISTISRKRLRARFGSFSKRLGNSGTKEGSYNSTLMIAIYWTCADSIIQSWIAVRSLS